MNPAAARVLIAGRRDPFYWRRPIVPQGVTCFLETVALPPNTISSKSVTVDMEQFLHGLLSFTASWDPPQYSNGALDRYELCIREDALTGSEDCTASSNCLYVEFLSSNVVGCTKLDDVNVASNGTVVGDINYHVTTTEPLFIQVRKIYMWTVVG